MVRASAAAPWARAFLHQRARKTFGAVSKWRFLTGERRPVSSDGDRAARDYDCQLLVLDGNLGWLLWAFLCSWEPISRLVHERGLVQHGGHRGLHLCNALG